MDPQRRGCVNTGVHRCAAVRRASLRSGRPTP